MYENILNFNFFADKRSFVLSYGTKKIFIESIKYSNTKFDFDFLDMCEHSKTFHDDYTYLVLLLLPLYDDIL